MHKACTSCAVEKPLSGFRNQKIGAFGKQAICRDCDSERCRKYKQANAGRTLGKTREYRLRNPAKQMVWSARERAKASGQTCSLSEADIVIPAVCPVFGTPLAHGSTSFFQASPSLDRIDPRLGYVPGNVAVISFRANALKKDATIAELERLIAWMRSVGAP